MFVRNGEALGSVHHAELKAASKPPKEPIAKVEAKAAEAKGADPKPEPPHKAAPHKAAPQKGA